MGKPSHESIKKDLDVSISPIDDDFQSQVEDSEDVFKVKEDGPNFRGVGTFGAAVLIAKSQFGLGVLGIPQTFSDLGIVPGLISLFALCFLSVWSGMVVGKFRLRHPLVYSIGDAAEVLFGKAGKEFIGCAFWLYYCLVYGAALITLSITFNVLSDHSICTTLWLVVGAVIAFCCGAFVRTMKVMSWFGYVALTTVFLSAWIVAIACLCQSRPAGAAAGETIDKQIAAFATGKPFSTIASAIGMQLLSLCGTAGFFNIHAEMRDQKQYNKALFIGQAFVVSNYIVLGCMVYGKVGVYVTSPALGSAGPLFKKICYGVALPGLLYTALFHAHLAGKYSLVRILRNTEHLQSNTFVHWLTWILLMLVACVLGFIVAGAIPFFDDLLSLVASMIGSIFMLIIPGLVALHQVSQYMPSVGDGQLSWVSHCRQNWSSSRRSKISTSIALFAIAAGVFIFAAGTYGSVQSIIDNYRNGTVSLAFSCSDNS